MIWVSSHSDDIGYREVDLQMAGEVVDINILGRKKDIWGQVEGKGKV